MLGTALTTLILGALAGAGAWMSWEQDRRGLSVGLTVLTLIFAVVAISTAFAGTVALVVRLLPILLILLVAWLGFKQLQKKSSTPKA